MLQEILNQVLTTGNVRQIGNQIGADESTTSNAIQLALPLIVSALSRNASTPQGADDLHNAVANDHDGSLLDDLGGFLLNSQNADGGGILGHILGSRQGMVANELSQQSGLNAGQVAQLLITLAPIIMAVLGRARQQQGLDSQGLSQTLNNQQQQYNEQSSSWMGLANQILDRDNDGSVTDDLAGLAARYFSK